MKEMRWTEPPIKQLERLYAEYETMMRNPYWQRIVEQLAVGLGQANRDTGDTEKSDKDIRIAQGRAKGLQEALNLPHRYLSDQEVLLRHEQRQYELALQGERAEAEGSGQSDDDWDNSVP